MLSPKFYCEIVDKGKARIVYEAGITNENKRFDDFSPNLKAVQNFNFFY